MNRIRLLLLSFFLLVFHMNSLAGQSMRFTHITSDDGLLQSHITCILEDRRGLIWFGTRNGLCRYNGYTFQTYTRKIGDPLSLPDNFIRSMFEDSKGRIWIGTDKGLCCYNAQENVFQYYEGIKSEVSSIVQTKDGNIYCAASQLYRIDTERKRVEPVSDSRSNKTIQNTYRLFAGSDNLLWIGGKQGLSAYNTTMTKVKTACVDAFDKNKSVIAIYQDRKGNLWIGKNGGGLIRQDAKTGEQNVFRQDGGVNENIVRVISEDRTGRIWAGTEGGLLIIDANGNITSVRQNFADRFSINDNAIYSILCDKQGNMWVGTYFGGANLYSADSEKIDYFEAGAGASQLKGKAVRQMVEQKGKCIWIATEDGGLNRLDITTGEISRVDLPVATSNIHSLQIGKDGNLWIGTFMGGLIRYNLDNSSTEVFTVQNSELPSNMVFSLYEDNDGDLWIGCVGGLCHRSAQTGKIELMRQKVFNDCFVYSLTGNGGKIWIGTRQDGLICYDKHTCKCQKHMARTGKGFLSDDFISTLAYDSNGNLWVGTNNGGLFRYDSKSNSFFSFIASNALTENCIYGITEDSEHRIWVSAGRNIYQYDDASGHFIQMHKNEAILLNHYNYESTLAASSGKLFFGSVNGLISFYPDNTINNYHPEIQLLGLTDAKGIEHYVDFSDDITLSASESGTINIDFSAISPSHSDDIVYAIKMEGVDKDWQYLSHPQRINYSNLPSGSYRFCIMASTAQGKWDEKNMRVLEITIQPPFYATWWAFLIYILVIAYATYYIVRLYRNRQKEKQEAFENRVEREKLEHLNEMKQNFFTDISHEIKTPLSLIIAPARQMLEGQTSLSAKMKDNMHTILKGAETLRLLVQELIDVNKLNKSNYELAMEQQNPLTIVSDLAHRFQTIAENKGVFYNIEVENWGEEVTFSVMALEKIVNNLLSNAFKFTPRQGTVDFSASLVSTPEKEGRWLELVVCDTGCGMSKEDCSNIFQKFYQADADGTKTQGWGIGLSVVKQMVESHGGTISVESKLGVGSTFTVLLDVTNQRVPVTDGKGQRLSIEDSLLISDELEDNSSHNDTLLIVEDNEDMRHYLRSLLSDEYNIMTATNGARALEMVENGALPDLIISDVMMPEMDGTEMCQHIKSDVLTAHIPVILLTAKTGTENAMKGYENGADLYIEKPFSSSMLQMQLKNLLKMREEYRKEFQKSEKADIQVMSTNKYDKKLLEDIQRVVEENIGNSNFCVNDIVDKVGVSRTKLHMKLKSLINMSIGDYIKEVRLRKSKELLLEGYSISETAYSTGFSDPNYFTKCFKKSFDILPRDFVKKAKEDKINSEQQ